MTRDEFLQDAPFDYDVPDELMALLEIEARTWRGPVRSADFALRPYGHRIARLYFGNADTASHFMVFGGDSAGAVYALWLYEGCTIHDAPVVYLESEGQAQVVIADTIRDFLRLLMVGVEELGFCIEEGDWESNVSQSDATRRFRASTHKRFGLSAPADPFEVVTLARERHPNLEQWLAAREVPRGFTRLP